MRKIHWFANNALTKILILSKDKVYIDRSGNVYIDQSGNPKLVFKVIHYQEMFYQDNYRPEQLSAKYMKTRNTSAKYIKTFHRLYNEDIIFIKKKLSSVTKLNTCIDSKSNEYNKLWV
jgi:hypothetical protein